MEKLGFLHARDEVGGYSHDSLHFFSGCQLGLGGLSLQWSRPKHIYGWYWRGPPFFGPSNRIRTRCPAPSRGSTASALARLPFSVWTSAKVKSGVSVPPARGSAA